MYICTLEHLSLNTFNMVDSDAEFPREEDHFKTNKQLNKQTNKQINDQ